MSTGTVTDHDGNRQGNDRQREYHRIGSVSIGSKVAGIRDKDLIDNVLLKLLMKVLLLPVILVLFVLRVLVKISIELSSIIVGGLILIVFGCIIYAIVQQGHPPLS